jgi:O-acetyl-ADP-ribose deacetylase (regulator of RNase III)
MPAEKKIGAKSLKVVREDITLLEVEAFVYYAQPNLQLGSGFGNAISVRGGPKIQEELNQLKQAAVTEVVVTTGGKLKAKHILHAVGPAFQEKDLEEKLRKTTLNALKKAEEQGLKQVALPAMGAGFYGMPLDACAKITLQVAKDYLNNGGKLEEVIFCLNDQREYRPFEAALNVLN